MHPHTECQRVADEAAAFSRSLWSALQSVGLRDVDLVHQSGLIFDQIADERVGSDEESTLWQAAAMKALPQERFDGPNRTIISRRFDAAWRAYSKALMADAEYQAADFRADQRRDERVSL